MLVDDRFFDDVFENNPLPVTEKQIDSACAKIMKLVETNKDEAKKADSLLARLLLHFIACGFITDPKRCAEHYFVVRRAAFGKPTLLDEVKAQSGM